MLLLVLLVSSVEMLWHSLTTSAWTLFIPAIHRIRVYYVLEAKKTAAERCKYS